MKRKHLFLGSILCGMSAFAQTTVWKHNGWEARVSDKGCLEQIIFKDKQGNDTIPFFHPGQGNCGPSFYAETSGKETTATWIPDGYLSYRATIDQVECRLTYQVWKGQPALKVTLENKGNVPFQPTKAGLKLGIDTYMDKYPDWFGKYFPTLMRNEKTHFYGYLQTPAGHALGIVSPQPVASWSVAYNLGYQDPPPHWFMGHRIESLNLDLMNALPLPERNPQDLWMLKQGEAKTWIVAFINIHPLEEFEQSVHKIAGIPMIRIDQTTYNPGETASFEVLSGSKDIKVFDDKGQELKVAIQTQGSQARKVSCILPETGLYTVRVKDQGKETEGILSVHPSWRWTMEQARRNALKYHQKATSHIESWYGFHPSFIAAGYFPDKRLDKIGRAHV